jgi:hypothetical protein
MRVTFELPEILVLGGFYFYYMGSIGFTIAMLVLGIMGAVIRSVEAQQLSNKLLEIEKTNAAVRNAHLAISAHSQDLH